MSPVLAGVLQLLALIAALALAYRPARRLHGPGLLLRQAPARREVDLQGHRRQPEHARCAGPPTCAASSPSPPSSVLFLYLLQRLQGHLPGSLGFPSIDPDQAFNTAASFVTNTNWQSYYGEQAMGHVVQTGGLAVQNFVSAAVGIAVAVALVRGFARSRTGELGNFWADLVRGTVRILLPISVIARDRAGRVRRDPELLRHPRGRPVHGRHAAVERRRGRLAGGHQGAGHQRRRLLQRQLRPPLREPDAVLQPLRDLPDPGHPVRADPHLRPDGRHRSSRATRSSPRWSPSGSASPR